jgi:hypothetical protein
VCAADYTAAPTAGNNTDLAGMSFQQYIIDLDMSYADGILVQETWTLLPGNATVTLVGLSVPADSTIMLFQKQDMSDATSAMDIEYDRTGDILYFSENITSVSSGCRSFTVWSILSSKVQWTVHQNAHTARVPAIFDPLSCAECENRSGV